jgi:hypothetical protein
MAAPATILTTVQFVTISPGARSRAHERFEVLDMAPPPPDR